MAGLKIPVGRSGFADIRKNGYYFIDKSGLIEELLKTEATQVTLITRPRRFGKTLAMSMLAEFFDVQKDSQKLFSGLSIIGKKELCKNWMNQYPTIFLSLKSVDGLDFPSAYAQLASVIAEVYKQHLFLAESSKLNLFDKEFFFKIAGEQGNLKDIKNSILKLTQFMELYYGKPAILLIDEYDVPFAKASEKGYYPEMLDAAKGIMEAIKDNSSLKFAILTGCLRIAKESIFTGTNNFVSDTISDTRLNEYFGFTQQEVNTLLKHAGLAGYAAQIKEWYDGYRFGNFEIYCPWDVMNHVRDLMLDPSSQPKNFWENTSDNGIIRMFLNRTDFDIHDKFEALLAGGFIREEIEENLTYDTLGSSERNLWSLLYLSGYLTKMDPEEILDEPLKPRQFALKIPNTEIMGIFQKSVKTWFTDSSAKQDRRELFSALWAGNDRKLTTLISDLLFGTISYHDYKESFYHAFLTGLFSNAGYCVESNYENGLGRADIVVKDRTNRRAAICEAKRAGSEQELETECWKALQQIEERQYAVKIEHDGFREVGRFGISFFQKKCLVKKK